MRFRSYDIEMLLADSYAVDLSGTYAKIIDTWERPGFRMDFSDMLTELDNAAGLCSKYEIWSKEGGGKALAKGYSKHVGVYIAF